MFGRRPAVIGQGRRQDATVQGLNFLRRSWARLAFGLLLGLVLGVGSTLWATAQELPPGQQLIPNPQQFRVLEQPNNALSVLRAEQLAAEADAAIQAQNYDRAIELLQQVFNAYNQRSNYHQDLSRAFAGIQNRISEEQRELARVAAQARDEAAYDLAVVYRAAGRPEEAVAWLIQVIKSQTPTRELGTQAYQQLLEIGFVSTPFP
ncbi:thioredoxin-like negative regulator of GroEL [Thermostichus sp. MS-CIW-21]